MCDVIKSRPEFKMGHVGSKTRSLGQFLEKPCVLSRRHSFDPVFMKLCQNDFLTLNKRLSRRAMLSDDSSCFSERFFLTHKDGSPLRGQEDRHLESPQRHRTYSDPFEISPNRRMPGRYEFYCELL